MAGAREELRLRDQLSKLEQSTSSELVNMSGEVRVVGTDHVMRFGGMFDTLTRSYVLPEPEEPAVIWEVSPEQFKALTFYRDDRGVPRMVLIGAMSSGKTAIAARACVMLATEFINAEIGIVGPTQSKLGPMKKKLGEVEVLPKSWVESVHWNTLFEPPYVQLKNGVKLRFVGAKAPSKQMGSPIHGFD